MASRLQTNGRYRRALRNLPEAAKREIAAGLGRTAAVMQANTVARVPVGHWPHPKKRGTRPGNLRRVFARKSAIGSRRGGLEVHYGLRTKGLKRRAFYGHFVEGGTRAYSRGDIRFKGSGKHGLGLYRKMASRVPARAPRPFFAPAYRMTVPVWRRNMQRALRLAVVQAASG